jgi:hypothetical protein
VRVCNGAKEVTVAAGTMRRQDSSRPSGTYIGAASAAGRRIAWVEARIRGSKRSIDVKVATVSSTGRVRLVHKIDAWRDSVRQRPALGVVLTHGGDLAWLHSSPGRTRVVLKRVGRAPRVIYRAEGVRSGLVELALEDGRTVRWNGVQQNYGYFDLRERGCPGGRSAFAPLLASDRVALTRAHYGLEDEGTVVIRGCDLLTGRDRVLAELTDAFPDDAELTAIGLDRTWALFWRSSSERQDTCRTEEVEIVDAASGRSPGPIALLTATCGGSRLPPPTPGAPFAVTDRGTAVWLRDAKLIAARDKTAIVLDQGAAIASLHAVGDRVSWTNDGVTRTVIP